MIMHACDDEISPALEIAAVVLNGFSLADRVGLSRQLVRQIRIGDRYAEVLPHLPRIDPQAMQRSCLDCQLFISRPSRLRGKDGSDIHSHGRCSIGIPEAENIHYARGCGAFVEA
jgi:hypothetical protein